MTSKLKNITWWRTALSRTTLFLFVWWVLTDGSASSWQIGLPAVVLVAILSLAVDPPSTLTWLEFLRFLPFFFSRSLAGGLDVASRALHPRMPIAPELIEFELRLPRGLARVFMANTVTLMPGTLSAAINGDVLTVHVLNHRDEVREELETVERRVARLFRASLEPSTARHEQQE